MGHNVKIKYYARENTKMTPHSFFAQPIPNGTYGFEEICNEAAENTTIEAGTIRQSVELYMKVVQKKLLDGFRTEVGKQFLVLGPGLTAKVKDYTDKKTGEQVVVTADDLTAVGAKGRVTATVNPEFSHEFNRSVKWQKSDKNGNVIEPTDDDATLDGDDDTNPTNQGGGNTGGNTGGGDSYEP